MNTSRELKLYFEFDRINVKHCNFNKNGELILFCTIRTNLRYDKINIVCVYSIIKNKLIRKSKCQKIFKITEEAKLISITKHNKIWLRLNNNLYEWDLLTAQTTIALKNIYEEVIIKIIYIVNLQTNIDFFKIN